MSRIKDCRLPARLEDVRRRFEDWRQSHRARSRIPESLWASAVKMADRYGINRTARALRLDYYSLKKRLKPKAVGVSNGEALATFLEVASVPSAVAGECTVELEDAGGSEDAHPSEGLRIARPDGAEPKFLERPVMIQITPQMRFVVAVEPADFRRGIDGLARLCQETLSCDPFSGWVFVFRNRRATALKILIYDGQGFWLCHTQEAQTTRHPNPGLYRSRAARP